MMSRHILMTLAVSVFLAHYTHAGQQDDLNNDVMLPGELQDEILAYNLLDSPKKKECTTNKAWTGEKCKCNHPCREELGTGNYWCNLENGGWKYCCKDDCHHISSIGTYCSAGGSVMSYDCVNSAGNLGDGNQR